MFGIIILSLCLSNRRRRLKVKDVLFAGISAEQITIYTFENVTAFLLFYEPLVVEKEDLSAP